MGGTGGTRRTGDAVQIEHGQKGVSAAGKGEMRNVGRPPLAVHPDVLEGGEDLLFKEVAQRSRVGAEGLPLRLRKFKSLGTADDARDVARPAAEPPLLFSAEEQRPQGQEAADSYRDVVIPAMASLRAVADEIETLVGEKYWPYPTYGRMLFSVE